MRWEELYKKYKTKHSASSKKKWFMIAIAVFASGLFITALAFNQQMPTAECGDADGICPINCDYKKDVDCSALTGAKTIIPRHTTTTTREITQTTTTTKATTSATTTGTTQPATVTTTTTTTENAAASDQASSTLASELELAIGSITTADIMNAINS